MLHHVTTLLCLGLGLDRLRNQQSTSRGFPLLRGKRIYSLPAMRCHLVDGACCSMTIGARLRDLCISSHRVDVAWETCMKAEPIVADPF